MCQLVEQTKAGSGGSAAKLSKLVDMKIKDCDHECYKNQRNRIVVIYNHEGG